jgi:NAD(P)H-hydrate epimerase
LEILRENEGKEWLMSQLMVLSREQARALDRIAIEQFGIPGLILMENAGRGCAELLMQLGVSTTSPVIICCGKGNNGGDGLVMARHLEVQGVPVEVILFHDPERFRGDAAVNYHILRHTDVPVHCLTMPEDLLVLKKHISRASWVVDALLGTGGTGGARPPYDMVIREINEAGLPVLAIDIPSGLDCDLGEADGAIIRAKATAALVAPKPGFRSEQGRQHIGDIHIVHIGVPHTLLVLVRGDAVPDENS